jgi:hypothetical protein
MKRPKECLSPNKEDCILDIDCTHCLYWQDELTNLETSFYYIDCLSLEMPHNNPELKYIKDFNTEQQEEIDKLKRGINSHKAHCGTLMTMSNMQMEVTKTLGNVLRANMGKLYTGEDK